MAFWSVPVPNERGEADDDDDSDIRLVEQVPGEQPRLADLARQSRQLGIGHQAAPGSSQGLTSRRLWTRSLACNAWGPTHRMAPADGMHHIKHRWTSGRLSCLTAQRFQNLAYHRDRPKNRYTDSTISSDLAQPLLPLTEDLQLEGSHGR